jgi:hypothetical protein
MAHLGPSGENQAKTPRMYRKINNIIKDITPKKALSNLFDISLYEGSFSPLITERIISKINLNTLPNSLKIK